MNSMCGFSLAPPDGALLVTLVGASSSAASTSILRGGPMAGEQQRPSVLSFSPENLPDMQCH